MKIAIAWADAGGGCEHLFDMPESSATVAEALRAAQASLSLPAFDAVGVWGRVRSLDHPLRDGDRIELYRPLKADPKEARRARATGKR